jgi:hypothetical protein
LGIKDYLITPNGNVYVGPNSGVPFRAGYSIEPNLNFRSTIVHELFHVFQNRNRGCTASNECLLALPIVSIENYRYTPLVPGKPFYNYNRGQEAELVSDRYRLRQGSNAQLSCNRSNAATLQELEQLLPKIFF